MNTTLTLRCSFCAKASSEVEKLIAGPGIYICDECVGLCNNIIAAHEGEAADASPFNAVEHFRSLADDDLKKSLLGAERVRRTISDQQQLVVDILRERQVSWAELGEAMDVTRQAVWRRFGSAD